MQHERKIAPQYLSEILRKVKKFEVREVRQGSPYRIGDTLYLREWENGAYSGKWAIVKITYILLGGAYGIAENYAVLGIDTQRSWLDEHYSAEFTGFMA